MQIRVPAVDQGQDRLELEIDHRGAHELDTRVSAQYLRRSEIEIDVLLVGPDAPLAAVDSLAYLELTTVGNKDLCKLDHGVAPRLVVANQIPILGYRKRDLVSGVDQRPCQLFLVAVVRFPGVEAQQHRADAELVDALEVAPRIFRPRPHREPDALESKGFSDQVPAQLAIAPSDRRRRPQDDRRVAHVRPAVGEPDGPLLTPGRVLVRLIREVVPHRLVARRSSGIGRREVRVVRAAVGVPAPQPQSAHPLLDVVFEDVGANRQIIKPRPERPPGRRFAPISHEKGRLVFPTEDREPADVAGSAVRAEPPAGAGAVEVDHVQLDAAVGVNREYVAHRQITVEDPRVVDAAGEFAEALEKDRRVDLRKVVVARLAVETAEELARLHRILEAPSDKEGRTFGVVGLHPQHRLRRGQPLANEFFGNAPTARRFAAPPPPVEPFLEALVAELFDDNRHPPAFGSKLCGVDVVPAPVDGLQRGRRIDQARDLDTAGWGVGGIELAGDAVAGERYHRLIIVIQVPGHRRRIPGYGAAAGRSASS